MYFKTETLHPGKDLKFDAPFDDFTCKYVPLLYLTPEDQEKAMSAINADVVRTPDGKVDVSLVNQKLSITGELADATKMLNVCIIEWNFHNDKGDPWTLGRDDPDTWTKNGAPSILITYLTEKMTSDSTETTIPPVIGNDSNEPSAEVVPVTPIRLPVESLQPVG